MNKIKKIIIFIIMLLMVFSVNVYANGSDISCKAIEDSAAEFKQKGEDKFAEQNLDIEEITSPIVSIVQMLITVGILIIGIIMVILGIQWVMAKPSPEAQAKLKKQFVSLAVSAGVLFGSYTIWRLVVIILDSIDG